MERAGIVAKRSDAVRRTGPDHDQRAVDVDGREPVADLRSRLHGAGVEHVGLEVERLAVTQPRVRPGAKVVAGRGEDVSLAEALALEAEHTRHRTFDPAAFGAAGKATAARGEPREPRYFVMPKRSSPKARMALPRMNL